MSEDIEYCTECRHPVIWHSRPDQPGRCCGCQEHEGNYPMTDDRAPFRANRDAGLQQRHQQRLARSMVCKNCGKPIEAVNWSNGPGWIHSRSQRSLCEHLRATPLAEETP